MTTSMTSKARACVLTATLWYCENQTRCQLCAHYAHFANSIAIGLTWYFKSGAQGSISVAFSRGLIENQCMLVLAVCSRRPSALTFSVLEGKY